MNLAPIALSCESCAHRPVCDIAKAFSAFMGERYSKQASSYNPPIDPDRIGGLCALHSARVIEIRPVEAQADAVMSED